jgi:hypothetical protein
MPFIIAAVVYGVLTGLVVALVAVIGLARGWHPGRAVLASTAGSLVGFLLGCAAAFVLCVGAPDVVGGRVGATAVIVPGSLTGALLGAAVAAAARRYRRTYPA